MYWRITCLCLCAVVVFDHLGDRAIAQGKRPAPSAKPAAASDEAIIRQQAEEFAAAFAKGDADAIAATWTEQAEFHTEEIELHGRDAIAAAFRSFFSEHAGAKIEFRIDGIRFPAKDLAIEEGLSIQSSPGAVLPTSARYMAIHVRDGGEWKTAVCREWAAEEDKLEDLTWLIGDWSAESPAGQTRINYRWSPSKSAIEGTMELVKDGQTVRSARQHILRDPQSGQLRSWLFDDDGGRRETLWTRDGDRWLLEVAGVSANGAETAALNVLTRLSDNEYLFVSASGSDDGRTPADPIKLTRAAAK